MHASKLIHLYPSTARTSASQMAHEINSLLRFSGREQAAWSLHAGDGGQFQLNLCGKSTGGDGLSVAVNDQEVRTSETVDTGWFHARLSLGQISLKPGPNTLTLRLATARGRRPLDLRALEMIACDHLATWQREYRNAAAARADHSWMSAAGYGVMVHWVDESAAMTPCRSSYEQAVAVFDVERFAQQMQDIGAGWVLFTVSHTQPHCPAPLASWERAFPGRTTRRDLIADLIAALNRRGIRLMLYVSSHVFLQQTGPDHAAAEAAHLAILEECGRRYGTALAGWWFDGWGWITENMPAINAECFYCAAKIGNPQRLVSCNFWTCVNLHPWSDFWAGEVVLPPPPMPGQRFYTTGPAVGQQRHLLLCLNQDWIYKGPSQVSRRLVSDEALIACIAQEQSLGGAVTINLAVSREGQIEPASMETMRRLRSGLCR